MIPQQTRVAVLFQRLGPYHHARLNAAGKWMDIFGVEACGAEDTYAWQKVEGATSFTRITLTDRQVEGRSWRKELRRKMWEALHQIKPRAVAVPGWSFTDALSALSWCIQTRTPAIIMSESTEWDEPRAPWKEWMKRQIVGLYSAALAGGTPHVEYLMHLGLPAERVFLGYDAVDNGYFEKKAEMLKTETLKAGMGLQDYGTTRQQDRPWSVVRGPVVLLTWSALGTACRRNTFWRRRDSSRRRICRGCCKRMRAIGSLLPQWTTDNGQRTTGPQRRQ